jgi:hypothetical protein
MSGHLLTENSIIIPVLSDYLSNNVIDTWLVTNLFIFDPHLKSSITMFCDGFGQNVSGVKREPLNRNSNRMQWESDEMKLDEMRNNEITKRNEGDIYQNNTKQNISEQRKKTKEKVLEPLVGIEVTVDETPPHPKCFPLSTLSSQTKKSNKGNEGFENVRREKFQTEMRCQTYSSHLIHSWRIDDNLSFTLPKSPQILPVDVSHVCYFFFSYIFFSYIFFSYIFFSYIFFSYIFFSYIFFSLK